MLSKILFFILGVIPLMAGGLALLGGGLYMGNREYELAKTGLPAKGSVIKVIEHTLSKGGANYYPKVTFTTAKGEVITFEATGIVGSYKVGDTADVVYSPQNPRNAEINTFAAMWAIPLIVTLVGFVSFCVSIYILFNLFRK
ncbi:MAG: DUF3592 domain-containing protein [Acidobacteriota bacterium]|nr:DUF3592 domain-containing protein [Acidobacteriota bacterium]